MQVITVLFPALPEIFVVVMACVILLGSVFSRNEMRHSAFFLSQLTLVVSAILSVRGFMVLGPQPVYAFHETFILDKLSVLLKVFIDIGMLFTFWYAHVYNDQNRIPAGEFYVLGLLATFGMMVLVSAADFITLFLGVELMSLPVYAMVALMRERWL